MELDINRKPISVSCDPAMPLLWMLRDYPNLTDTKFGCGVAMCDTCTIHVDGATMRSCVLPVTAVASKHTTAIEGLTGSGGRRRALQRAWIDEQVPQCDYCQSGMLMAAADLLTRHPDPTDADIDAAMTNTCRCGTYPHMCTAIKHAARTLREDRV